MLHLHKSGQHTIEYCAAIALVALGIILMRDYVYRSVFAHLKLWEDGVNDSLSVVGCSGSAEVDGETGVSFCRMSVDCPGRFVQNCCPSGWVWYRNWCTTTDVNCMKCYEGGGPYFIPNVIPHGWANQPPQCAECGENEYYCCTRVTEIGCVPAGS